jgi:hypothetical protein
MPAVSPTESAPRSALSALLDTLRSSIITRKVLVGQIVQRMTASCECDPLSETTASSARRASSSHSFARRNQTNLCRSISDEAASSRQLSAWRRSSSPLRAAQCDRVSVRSSEACTIPKRNLGILRWFGHVVPANTANGSLTPGSVATNRRNSGVKRLPTPGNRCATRTPTLNTAPQRRRQWRAVSFRTCTSRRRAPH